MAMPANNAAVLTNSFFLMEWSSSLQVRARADPCGSVQKKTSEMVHRFITGSTGSRPCRPMRIGSEENE
jgi:hypothetical protein